MKHFILPTKLLKPELNHFIVSRYDTEEKLNNPKHKIVLVSCQTGYGKSTLISHWLDSHPLMKYVWYNLDSLDDNYLMFMTYLTEGIKRENHAVGRQLEGLLSQFNNLDSEQFLYMYARLLYQLEEKITIVLDDFHFLSHPQIHQTLELFVNFLCDQVKLIIITRETPHLKLNKHGLNGTLLRLSEVDLKLDTGQVLELLKDTHLSLKDPAHTLKLASELTSYTEGWVAAVKMALVTLNTMDSPRNLTFSPSSSQQEIIHNMLLSLLDSFPQNLIDYLMVTSIPDQFSKSMSDDIFENFVEDSHKQLEVLLKKNMFLIVLDTNQGWYRYHHLFRQVMVSYHKGQLGSKYEYQSQSIKTAIARWYEKEKNFYEAAKLYVTLDLKKAAHCIELLWDEMYLTLNSSTWLSLAHSLPQDLVMARPVLSMAWAWALIDTNRIDKAQFWLDHTESIYTKNTLAGFEKDGLVSDAKQFGLIEVNLLLARAYVSAAKGLLPELFEYGNKAVELMEHETYEKLGVVMMTMAFAYWNFGDLEEAEAHIIKAIQYEIQYGDTINVDNFKMVKFWFLLYVGKYEILEKESEKLISTIEEDLSFPILLPTLHLILAYSAYKQNINDKYNHHIKKARSHAKTCALMDFEYKYYILRSLIHLDQKDFASAQVFLSEAKYHLYPNPIPDFYTIEYVEKRLEEMNKKIAVIDTHSEKTHTEPLTVRELEVLELIESGLSNKEISQTLFLAISTVKSYNQNIFSKLDVRRRTEAVAKAKQLRII